MDSKHPSDGEWRQEITIGLISTTAVIVALVALAF
tara:strand:- start:51 stop:155 length:105 start_codon:yes stop_codon:yes gene_type:complete